MDEMRFIGRRGARDAEPDSVAWVGLCDVRFVRRINDGRIRRVAREPSFVSKATANCGCEARATMLRAGAPRTRVCEPWEYPVMLPTALDVAELALASMRVQRLGISESVGVFARSLPPLGEHLAAALAGTSDSTERALAIESFAGPPYLLQARTPPDAEGV